LEGEGDDQLKWKIEEFSSSFSPISLIVDWRERDKMNSSG